MRPLQRRWQLSVPIVITLLFVIVVTVRSANPFSTTNSSTQKQDVILNKVEWSTYKKLMHMFLVFMILYAILVVILITSKRAQSYLVYLHIIQPPRILFPLTNLMRYRLSNHGRNIQIKNLRGWHLLPPGEPFLNEELKEEEEVEKYFEKRLQEKHQRIMIFFHGNSGNRSFPPKRLHILKLLNSNFKSHIFTFDYTGFGDSTGKPSEKQMYLDCEVILKYIHSKIDKNNTSSIFLYGQSLGTFPVMYLSSNLNNNNHPITGVILDAPPASIYHAALTHPVMKPFRFFGLSKFFHSIIKENFNNLNCASNCKFPLLILHGGNDQMIPMNQGKMIADICKQNGNNDVNFYVFNNVGHVDVSGADLYLHTLNNFIIRLEKKFNVGHHRSSLSSSSSSSTAIMME